MIRGVANFYAWMCILSPIFGSLSVARRLLDLEKWGPFAGTVVFLIITLLLLRTVTAPPRQPEAEGLGSSLVR